jgi:predicted metallo-beta-lactamase superfamily hydrolase
MIIKPIASDSTGVRSMATYVETDDCRILIDPSAALGPKRYGLAPHQKEHEMLFKTKQEISKIAQKCDILTISHYHYDHYDPNEVFYKEKKIFAKDISKNINKSQMQRGKEFKENVENICDLIYGDNSTHNFGKTSINFSPPFFHGPENVRLGYVIMTTIDDGIKKILHASDVQGPVTKSATDYIIKQKPNLLIMDGPPTIFKGWKISERDIENAAQNLLKIIKETKCEVILDHHLLRDIKYEENFPEPYNLKDSEVKTFAEYLGNENNTLEAHRKELWRTVG